jgi:hypothetical protein
MMALRSRWRKVPDDVCPECGLSAIAYEGRYSGGAIHVLQWQCSKGHTWKAGDLEP